MVVEYTFWIIWYLELTHNTRGKFLKATHRVIRGLTAELLQAWICSGNSSKNWWCIIVQLILSESQKNGKLLKFMQYKSRSIITVHQEVWIHALEISHYCSQRNIKCVEPCGICKMIWLTAFNYAHSIYRILFLLNVYMWWLQVTSRHLWWLQIMALF